MLTERIITDKIEVVGEYRHVQVRMASIIERDGVEISRAYIRHVIAPGDDYAGDPDEVRLICAAVHTDDVVAAYAAHVAEQETALGDVADDLV